MELISKMAKKIKLSRIKTKVAITICIMTILGIHFVYGWFMVSSYRISSFFVSICLSIIIYLWIYFAPKLDKEIEELKNCFNELGYNYAYNQYRLNIVFSKKGYKPCITYEEVEEDEERKKKDFPFHRLVKIVYIICWLIITIYLGVAFCKSDLIVLYLYLGDNGRLHLVGIINIILYVFTMLLNGNGFYYCFANIYFLKTIGRKKFLEEWKYNKYLPATTSGFRQIFTYSKRCILMYLLVSSLFSLAYTIMIMVHPDVNSIDPRNMFCMTFLVILIGAGTSIALFVASHIFMQRILNRWKRQSHIMFQAMLSGIDECDLEKTKTIIQLIKEMENDKVNYDFRVVLSVILS